ncbi:MAG: flagellar biosynthesis protein FlhB [Planctomycetota bacterium]
MADEDKSSKTEAATPRRLEEARSEGQVAVSTEFIAAVMLAATGGAFLAFGDRVAAASGDLIQGATIRASRFAMDELAIGDISALLDRSFLDVLVPFAILVAPVLAVGLLVGYGQVGFRIAPKAIAPKPQKLDPIAGFKKILGPRGAMRTLLGVLRIGLIGVAVAVVAWLELPGLAAVAGTSAQQSAVAIGHLFVRATAAGILVVVVLAVVDLVYQRLQFARDMRMSKKELRDEHKNTEGDPQVRARIRQIQRELATSRMMDDVPDATVVVTNPTHYAVALRYDDGADGAPRVVAKGLDEVALRIRSIASENAVHVVEEPPLARSLHAACNVGDAVPEELFEAVAKVLAYVYRLQQRGLSA